MSLHQGYRLRFLLEERKINIVHLSDKLGLSRSTIYNYFEMEEIPRKKLLPICRETGIEINDVLFASSVNESKTEYQKMQERVKSLEQMLKDKEVIIINQQEIIDLLKQSKSKK